MYNVIKAIEPVLSWVWFQSWVSPGEKVENQVCINCTRLKKNSITTTTTLCSFSILFFAPIWKGEMRTWKRLISSQLSGYRELSSRRLALPQSQAWWHCQKAVQSLQVWQFLGRAIWKILEGLSTYLSIHCDLRLASAVDFKLSFLIKAQYMSGIALWF